MPLGVFSVDMLHDLTEIRFWRFNQQVIMVGHQTVGMNNRIIALTGFFKGGKKGFKIVGIMENRLTIASPIHHMVKSTLVL